MDAIAANALLLTDTTFRDAHQSLLATRVRTYDMLAIANFVAHQLHESVQPGNVGRRDLRRRAAVPASRIPGSGCGGCGSDPEHLLSDAAARVERGRLHRVSRQRGRRSSSTKSAEQGIDIFRIFDSLNWLPNMQVPMEAVRKTRSHLRSGDLLHGRHSRSRSATSIRLQYYVRMAKELERMGAHVLAIKDMAGLCKPYAAERLVRALREEIGLADPLPHARHQRHQCGFDPEGVRSGRAMWPMARSRR